jgi:NAD(P)-dependent dehydrogenase (short-subunit alcohol dehydrogenase family)
MSANGLGGRTLLVVGGGSGIGLAAAAIAAREGANVTIADIDPSAAARAKELGAAFVECDATDAASAEAAVRATADQAGRLDCLFTTVGGAHIASLDELDPEAWSREIDFNLGSAYNVCRAALPLLKDQRSGAVVTTSSGFAAMPGTDRAGYTAAKAGVIAFTRSLASALAPYRARANCIAPGPTDTPRFRAMNGGDAGVEEVRRSMPLGEIPTPEDCANVALFLLSDAARQVTGQVIHVNGGLLMP